MRLFNIYIMMFNDCFQELSADSPRNPHGGDHNFHFWQQLPAATAAQRLCALVGCVGSVMGWSDTQKPMWFNVITRGI